MKLRMTVNEKIPEQEREKGRKYQSKKALQLTEKEMFDVFIGSSPFVD